MHLILMALKKCLGSNKSSLKNIMKNLFLVVLIFVSTTGTAQTFSEDIANAQTSYSAGKLEDAHFALQQSMQEIDMIIGKEVLKQLPDKMDVFTANSKDDNITSNVGFVGTTIHRSYGPAHDVDLSIIGNSPLISTINAFLNTPLLGGMMSN